MDRKRIRNVYLKLCMCRCSAPACSWAQKKIRMRNECSPASIYVEPPLFASVKQALENDRARVVVYGEPGLGKSALACALVQHFEVRRRHTGKHRSHSSCRRTYARPKAYDGL